MSLPLVSQTGGGQQDLDLGYLWCLLCAEHGIQWVSHEVGSPPVSQGAALGDRWELRHVLSPGFPGSWMLCSPQHGKSLPRAGWASLLLCSQLEFKHLGGIFSTLSMPW